MDETNAFVGKHTPVLRAGCGIVQHDLAIVKGKQYVSYVWLKGRGEAVVKLAPKSAGSRLQTLTDAVAALTEDGKALTIGVVNPNPDAVAVQLTYSEVTPRGSG